ncbi:addiction module HigA family antidote [Pedobacter sp. CG_S7]|jgi:antitoxin HigA-1|uniref:HigA family addiction module antitoxin n=1 Tax=Pedobacter sp. CG_S7 TaxID=3143930 RepID=UPI00339ADF90
MNTQNVQADHPGRILEQMIIDRKIVRSKMAMDIGMYPTQITDIVKGRKDISPVIALRLENAFDLPAEYWLEQQMKYDLFKERLNLESSKINP